MELSKTEEKILRFLTKNGVGISERKMAKELKLSPSTLIYKLRKLERERVLLGYQFRVDYGKIGLRRTAWVLLSLGHLNIDINEVINSLLNHPQIHMVLFITGDFDLALKVYGSGIDEITKFVLGIENKMGDVIESSVIYFVSKRYVFHSKRIDDSRKRVSIDKIDFELLRIRLENPRLKLIEVATEVGLHRNTVGNRWKRLVKEEVVLKKSPIINPENYLEAGTAFKAIVFFKLVPGKIEEFAERFSKLSEIHELNLISASFDLMAIVRTRNLEDFYMFQRKLFGDRRLSCFITKIKSCIIMRSRSHPLSYLSELGWKKFVPRKVR